jgi:hypothetical protein
VRLVGAATPGYAVAIRSEFNQGVVMAALGELRGAGVALVAALTLALVGCGNGGATPGDSPVGSPSTGTPDNSLLPPATTAQPDNSEHRNFTVVAATHRGVASEATGWELNLPLHDPVMGTAPLGSIFAIGVCGHANFEITASGPGTFTARDRGIRSLEVCDSSAPEVVLAEAAFKGTVTAKASGSDVVLSNGDYTLTLRPS